MLRDGDAPSIHETDLLPAAQTGLAGLLSRLDRLFALLLASAAVLDGAIWLYVGLRQSTLPDVLAIHYSSSGQVDRVGLRQQLYILPAIGLLTLLLNGVLAFLVTRREVQLAYVLLSVAVVVQLLLAGAAFQLIH